MTKYNKYIQIIVVLLIGGCVQILLALLGFACVKDSPGKVALEFTNAYFQLDESMSDLLCMEYRKVGDTDAVDEYIHSIAEKARERGFGRSFMQSKLYHMETETNYRSNTEADVRITGKRRISINPVYAYVANLFNIGEVYRIDETVRVIEEEDKWKVCADLSSVFGNT